MKKTFVLGILDGWGVAPQSPYNAITQANPQYYNSLLQSCPHSELCASGEGVGLPSEQMGNSEVGHLTIGAGRVIYQDLPRINRAIADGSFNAHPDIEALRLYHASRPGTKCHIIGLVSDGGVHSHMKHIEALCEALKDTPKALHAITDGRDCPMRSCSPYLSHINTKVEIVSISGRYYAMDRDNRWDRIRQAYNAMFLAEAPSFDTHEEWVRNSYKEVSDEFIKPAIKAGYMGLTKGDSIIIANFRADRVRQLLRALFNKDLGFEVIPYEKILGMTHYGDEFDGKIITLFRQHNIHNTLGEVISLHGKQIRLAETEKYAHVTYFLNGGQEEPFTGEERVMVPSPNVATYDMQPEMSIFELTQNIVMAIDSGKYDFICFNFANPDMVGHTGNMEAAMKAIKAVDKCLETICKAITANNSELLLTADHGNVEAMHDLAHNQPHTAHTMNPVPLIYFGPRNIALEGGGLADIAPTILFLMDLPIPEEMTGLVLAHA